MEENQENNENINEEDKKEDPKEEFKAEIAKIAQEILDEKLKDQEYHDKKTQDLLNSIVNNINEKLAEKEDIKALKFITTGVILENGSSNLNMSSSCIWNKKEDGQVTVKFKNDYLDAYVIIFFLAC